MKINVLDEQMQLENPELAIGRITKPVILEIWNGRQKDSVIRREYPYTRITQTENGLKACAEIEDEWVGKTEVTDVYCVEEGSVVLSRQVRILKESEYPGIRLRTEISLFPERKNNFEELRYFAPPAIYDKNDLDDAMGVLEANQSRIGYVELHAEKNIAKLSIVGAGMMSNPGVAAKMFESLYIEGVNINMISTSEIRITVLINEKDGIRAMNAVHDAFGLAD